MIAKIKITCKTCSGKGFRIHQHTNRCYTGLEHKLLCSLIEKRIDCRSCYNSGYIIHTGEVLELDPRG